MDEQVCCCCGLAPDQIAKYIDAARAFPYVVKRWRGTEIAAFRYMEEAREYQAQKCPSGSVVARS